MKERNLVTLDDVYEDLIALVSEVGAQADVPAEAEAFFSELVAAFPGEREEFVQHARKNLRDWFRAVNAYPVWVQEAEWPFSNGRPMVFVGQIDVPAGKGLFHDDAAFYVFWDPETGDTREVIQVA